MYGGASHQKPASSRVYLGKLKAKDLGRLGPLFTHSTTERRHIVGRLALTRVREHTSSVPLCLPNFGSLFGKTSCHYQVPRFI